MNFSKNIHPWNVFIRPTKFVIKIEIIIVIQPTGKERRVLNINKKLVWHVFVT